MIGGTVSAPREDRARLTRPAAPSLLADFLWAAQRSPNTCSTAGPTSVRSLTEHDPSKEHVIVA